MVPLLQMDAPSEFPQQLSDSYEGWRTELVQAPYSTATWKLTSTEGEVHFAKVARKDLYPTLAHERDRTTWARSVLPVPQVLGYGADDDVEWLVTSSLPGTDATRVKDDPEAVVRALAEGLRRFHEASADGCPFDFTLDAAVEHCIARVEAGMETWDDLHEDFKHHTPQTALEELLATRPSSEDVVVCHGDYCFPNMLMEDGVVTGYLDLGELGLADRWWDIAVGAWSVTWNVDARLEPVFYEAYGVEPDPERVRFYRLMYDLAS
jgi:aminoglycoside phosphotransferase